MGREYSNEMYTQTSPKSRRALLCDVIKLSFYYPYLVNFEMSEISMIEGREFVK